MTQSRHSHVAEKQEEAAVQSEGVKYAVFDDTCGNLIQIYQQTE
jgi:hypothetical protein